MTTEEFHAVEEAIAKSYPVREVPFIVGWALAGLPRRRPRRMFTLAGVPYRLLYALVRRRFERSEACAFRYGDGGVMARPRALEASRDPGGEPAGRPASPTASRARRPVRRARPPRHAPRGPRGHREVAVDRAGDDGDAGDRHPPGQRAEDLDAAPGEHLVTD